MGVQAPCTAGKLGLIVSLKTERHGEIGDGLASVVVKEVEFLGVELVRAAAQCEREGFKDGVSCRSCFRRSDEGASRKEDLGPTRGCSGSRVWTACRS